MEFKIPREKLLRPLSQVVGVVERRQTLPILANVLLTLEGGSLTLTGTDLEIEVTNGVPDVQGSEGTCTVTARKLVDICRSLPDDAELAVKTEGERAVIRSGRSRFSLHVLPAEDFPALQTDDWDVRFSVSSGDLKNLLESTAFSMAQQDVRYYLNGLLVELDADMLRTVATDGHRLAKSELKLESSFEQRRQAIVPRKAVLELSRLLEESDRNVDIALNPSHIRFSFDSVVFTSKLIDGRFPDYGAVIAPDLPVVLAVDRAQLYDTLNRAAILTNEKFRGVRVTMGEGRILVSAHNPEQEEATDEMPIDYDGENIEIGFNVTYLMDAVKALTTDIVEMRVQDGNTSCTMNSPGEESTLYLVMPMRL